jgi:hypothetical protein
MESSQNLQLIRRPLSFSIIGAILLLIGLAAAIVGPIEFSAFALFTKGGRFHYDGFTFGSFMFGNISWQIIGYYAIAMLCIPLGYAHLRPRRWARLIMISLLWCFLIVGIPLMVIFFLMLTVKDLSLLLSLLIIIALGAAYLLLPALLIRFYKSQNVSDVFKTLDKNSYWIERLPGPILTLGTLIIFDFFILHVPLFFNGIFPFFGKWLSGIRGYIALDISIVSLGFLVWGVLRRRVWSWWGSLLYFATITLSVTMSLFKSSLSDMLSPMRFAPTEMRLLEGIPLQGIHFIPFVAIPLLITILLLIRAKRHFIQS